MEISPLRLSLLLGWSFVFGLLLGVLNDINRIIRVLFGAVYSKKHFSRLYEITLPIVKRPLGRREGKVRRGVISLLTFFQDVGFFLIAGIGISVLHYEFNEGRFRFFSVIAVVVGFVLYYFTVGKLALFVSEGIVFFVKAFFLIVFGTVLRPFVFLGRFFTKKLKKIVRFFNITIANMQKKLYNINVKENVDPTENKE